MNSLVNDIRLSLITETSTFQGLFLTISPFLVIDDNNNE